MPNIPSPPGDALPGIQQWMREVRRLLNSEGLSEFIHGWVADDFQTVVLGDIPKDAYVKAVNIHVTEAFDSDGTDQIQVGWTSDNDALATLTDVSTTGVKAVTLGANNGYNGTGQTVTAYYVNGGSEPTTGKAIVSVEFFRVNSQIS